MEDNVRPTETALPYTQTSCKPLGFSSTVLADFLKTGTRAAQRLPTGRRFSRVHADLSMLSENSQNSRGRQRLTSIISL